MKKWKFCFSMAGLAFLISISVISCQTDDSDSNSQQAADVTAADLFIASEAYQNLQKEIRKDMRRERNAISKLSKEELEQYRFLQKGMLNIETRTDAIAQLKILTGYDYQTNRDRISSLVREVFKDTDFTKLDLMRARRKSQMYKIAITRTETNAELREQCKKDCEENSKDGIIQCYKNFNQDIEDLPASEIPNGKTFKHYLWVRDNCILFEEEGKEKCIEGCDKSFPDEK